MATEQLENLGSEDAKWLGKYSRVHMNVFGTPLRVMDHGEGAHIWDVDGNEYLDFLAGIAVNALGYAHPKWVKAVSEQAAKAAHVSNYFATEPQIKLASKLIELAGAPEGSHVYFGNSGAEGNEAALKLAKLYGRTLPGASPAIGGKPARIIAMTHGFHGRTMGALSATWKPSIREAFEPLVPNIEFVEAGDEAALHDAFAETGPGKYGKGPVAAVIMELIQGEAGVRPLGAGYVKKARQMCDDNNALLIIDEVQTGIGRTGSWFAFQREDLAGGVVPDIVTFAKGVAGGFPMGGMISFGAKLSALFTPGSHGSTFAGNPLGAAAAMATTWLARRGRTRPSMRACGDELGVGTRFDRQRGGARCTSSCSSAGGDRTGHRSGHLHPREDSNGSSQRLNIAGNQSRLDIFERSQQWQLLNCATCCAMTISTMKSRSKCSNSPSNSTTTVSTISHSPARRASR